MVTPGDPTINDAAAGQSANAWPRMAYDLGSTYHNSAETILTKANAAKLEVAWRSDMGDNVYGAPLQVNGVVYASSQVVVRAFDGATGNQHWRNTRAGTTGCLAYDEGVLYLHTINGEIIALNAATGEQKWAKPAGPQKTDGSSSPIVHGDLILLGGSDGELSGTRFRGYLSALQKATGAQAWVTYTVPTSALGVSIWSTIAVDPTAGLIFATTGNNHGPPATDTSDAFVAFALEGGSVRWKNQRTMGDTWSLTSGSSPDADFGANPVLYDVDIAGVKTQMVSSGQKSGNIHGVRRSDGMALWSRQLCQGAVNGSRGIFVNTSWSGKSVLAACNTGSAADLFALNGATGEILWKQTLPGIVYGRISSANGVGFVGAGTQLVVFDVDTGSTLKTIPSMAGTVTGTVTIVDGRVAYGEGMSWNSAVTGSTLTVLRIGK